MSSFETPSASSREEWSRRGILQALAGLGIGGAVFGRAIAAQAAREGKVTPEMLKQAEWIAGLELTDEERTATARAVERTLRQTEQLRSLPIGYDVPPCLAFVPAPGLASAPEAKRNQATLSESRAPKKPDSADDLAFLPVSELAPLIRSRQVSSVELTKLALDRLKTYDPLLKCVVNLTEDLAMRQAARADAELAAGRYRGPLHGVPWGAKDLIAVAGYPSTWGAPQFKESKPDRTATSARLLEEAGAVLVAKLSLGALAMGDRWFGGMTRNPWDPRQGSSGSSAGSASATSAGLVPFAIGSETLGSIVSPSRVCGTTGLRPTFGRVSRAGCMSLSWSMDKLGPIARSAEDCALAFDAIHGSDREDPAAVDQPFVWPPRVDLRGLRVGFFAGQAAEEKREELRVLKELGVKLIPIELPSAIPARAVALMLDVEAAAVFDELTRNHVTEGLNSWPLTFRQAQFVTAVEYLRASRARTLLMRAMSEFFEKVDLYVGIGEDLVVTNLTGHPTVALPSGFRPVGDSGRKVPNSISFTGRLYDESTILAVACAYQRMTGHHLERPPIAKYLEELKSEEAKKTEKAEPKP